MTGVRVTAGEGTNLVLDLPGRGLGERDERRDGSLADDQLAVGGAIRADLEE